MDTTAKKKQPIQFGEALLSERNENFDFDLWAKEVKRQMLAALQKRESCL